jgi:hypothetical protein
MTAMAAKANAIARNQVLLSNKLEAVTLARSGL